MALAQAVLATEPVRLALAVLDGGPHALTRATELAAALLAEPFATAVDGDEVAS